MGLVLVLAPTATPVTLAEAKAHLRVDHNDEDALISALIPAATNYAQVFMGRAIMQQTYEYVLDKFPPQIMIPMPPLIRVEAVRYDDGAGVEQTLVENTDYVVDIASQPGWVVPVNAVWPETIDAINSVRIRYVAGYVNAFVSPPVPNVPDDIKAALLLLIGSMYAFRETMVVGTITTAMAWSAEQLLRGHRVEMSMA